MQEIMKKSITLAKLPHNITLWPVTLRIGEHIAIFWQYTVKSFIFVGLKIRWFEFNNEFVDI